MYQLRRLVLVIVVTWSFIPPADIEEQVEITTPDNSVFIEKSGTSTQVLTLATSAPR